MVGLHDHARGRRHHRHPRRPRNRRRLHQGLHLPVDRALHPRHVPGPGPTDASTRAPRAAWCRNCCTFPASSKTVLSNDAVYEALGRDLYRATDFLFLGRGIHFPIALEGALKLKEISYIHAEGYPAGEMKHGPNALIDENLPVVVLATHDPASEDSRVLYEKTLSNIQEVKAREGIVVAVVTEGDKKLARSPARHRIPASERTALADSRNRAAAAAGVSHCRAPRLRCGPAPQPGQERDGGVVIVEQALPPASCRIRPFQSGISTGMTLLAWRR